MLLPDYVADLPWKNAIVTMELAAKWNQDKLVNFFQDNFKERSPASLKKH